MTDWDFTTDFLVVGSGAGGMTAAIVAKREGLDALVVEKTEFFGGSSAISGGGVWVPNNPLMAAAGFHDSPEKARAYMAATVGDRVPAVRREAYLAKAPEMVAYMLQHSHLHLEVIGEYTDYYPDRPGAMTGGRALDPGLFAGRRLGPLLQQLRPHEYDLLIDLAFTTAEVKKIALFRRSFRFLLVAAKVFLRTIWSWISGAKLLGIGKALVAPLRLSLHELGVPVWLNTDVKQLIVEGGRVVGIAAQRGAAGQDPRAPRRRPGCGWLRSQRGDAREIPAPSISAEWTSASAGNTGDAIRMGLELGAAIDLIEEAWWGPSSLPPGGPPSFHLVERTCPGSILVDSTGKRFTNEATSYVDVVHAMYAHNRPDAVSIPAHFIVDQRSRGRYPFGALFPGQRFPEEYFESGYVKRADTLAELAEKIGVDRQGLLETVGRFNEFARSGKDLDFQRGESVYDRYYGDPTTKPNPCLGRWTSPPLRRGDRSR